MPERSPAVVVRTLDLAHAGDVAVVGRLRRRWADEQGNGAIDDPEVEARLASWAPGEAEHRTVWGAVTSAADGSEPVGMVTMLDYRRMPAPGRETGGWGYLAQMFVGADHRDVGVGRTLLDVVLAEARTRGYERVVLSPTARSVPFYRRAGFAPAGEELLVLSLV